MPNPSIRWDRVPVWGTWLRIDDTPDPGNIEMVVSQRITATDGSVIYAGGAKLTVPIGDQTKQDATIRSIVRAAQRAADEAAVVAAGGTFDGTSWDTWWDTVVVPASIFTSFPASNDPNIVPRDWSVTVKEALQSGAGKQYSITPLLEQLDLPVPGINLGLVEVPPGSPTVPAPMYAKGVPGGVASLDVDGLVPVDQLPDIGGASTVDELTDATTVGKAVVKAADAAAARAAIGAQAAGSYAAALGADDNYVTDAEKVKLANLSGTNTGDQTLPTWSTIAGKPAVVAAGTDAAAARTAIDAAQAAHNHNASAINAGSLDLARMGAGVAVVTLWSGTGWRLPGGGSDLAARPCPTTCPTINVGAPSATADASWMIAGTDLRLDAS